MNWSEGRTPDESDLPWRATAEPDVAWSASHVDLNSAARGRESQCRHSSGHAVTQEALTKS